MKNIEPLTQNQEELFRCYKNNQNLVAYGCAGTGKTYQIAHLVTRLVAEKKYSVPIENLLIITFTNAVLFKCVYISVVVILSCPSIC